MQINFSLTKFPHRMLMNILIMNKLVKDTIKRQNI